MLSKMVFDNGQPINRYGSLWSSGCSLPAGALRIGWFVVLLIPSVTREWLLADVFKNLGCLVVASIIVAFAATFLYGGLANLHNTISLYVMGFTAAAIAFVWWSPMGYSVSM
jgi:hypothetical protein